MTCHRPIAALSALGLFATPAFAATADDAAALRAELANLKASYAARVDALEARIVQLEAAAANPQPLPEPPAPPPDGRSSATAFNPAISLIIGGSYTDTSRDPGNWHIAGFIPGGDEVGPGERSFNLGESELTLSANVDPYFSATMTAAVTGEGEIEVEEAFFRTLALRAGFTAKGGRFFSGFGYLNEVHAHAWDFVDQPLVYQAFFGNQMAQDGLQVKWLAPTDLFLEFGAEAGNGDAFPGTRRNRNGLSAVTLFAHVGGDLGVSTSWRAGAAWLDQRAENRSYEDTNDLGVPVVDAFTGKSRTWVVDAVLKWAPNGDVTRRQLKVQGEYMRREENGALAYDVDGLDLAEGFRNESSGWYLQTVYQFRPRWRVGARYDALDSGSPRIALVDDGTLPADAFPLLRASHPDRATLMLDWSLSEFTRLRAQYAWDDARGDGERDRQVRLQYLFGIGAHGAHKY
ncbi:MAG TPA: hypothetical protein PK555_09020 [Steroidobacteraceae bacterium]|nr:hypothetical protein [Steroidobacteraceae bacterium]